MKVIILTAGKGSRLYPLTENKPKSLVLIKNKPILEYIIENLPDELDEIILITEYKEQKIRDYVKRLKINKKMQLIKQGELGGTWGAIISAKNIIRDGEYFVTLNGDDIYDKEDIRKFITNKILYGVSKSLMPKAYYDTTVSKQGNLEGFKHQKEPLSLINATAGIYTLNKEILNLESISVGGNEHGIPQTLLKNKENYPAKIIEINNWIQINTKEDLKKAERLLL